MYKEEGPTQQGFSRLIIESIAVRSAPYYSSNKGAKPFRCSFNRISSSSGILQSSLRKWNFLNHLAEVARNPRAWCPAGALPCPGSWGPGSHCTEGRESLSMEMDGLCSKPGCSVVLLGETLRKVYSEVSLYTQETIWRNCCKLPQLWSLLKGKHVKLRFPWENMKFFPL